VNTWSSGVLQGLIAISENEFYVATRNYLFQFDATTWGWIHLLVGLIVAFAGWGLLAGRTWARAVAITLAVLSAIANSCGFATTRSGRGSSSRSTASSSVNSTRSLGQIRCLSGHAAEADCAAW
jgi:cytochrome bd-type quinol oxidase subunit 1